MIKEAIPFSVKTSVLHFLFDETEYLFTTCTVNNNTDEGGKDNINIAQKYPLA